MIEELREEPAGRRSHRARLAGRSQAGHALHHLESGLGIGAQREHALLEARDLVLSVRIGLDEQNRFLSHRKRGNPGHAHLKPVERSARLVEFKHRP